MSNFTRVVELIHHVTRLYVKSRNFPTHLAGENGDIKYNSQQRDNYRKIKAKYKNLIEEKEIKRNLRVKRQASKVRKLWALKNLTRGGRYDADGALRSLHSTVLSGP